MKSLITGLLLLIVSFCIALPAIYITWSSLRVWLQRRMQKGPVEQYAKNPAAKTWATVLLVLGVFGALLFSGAYFLYSEDLPTLTQPEDVEREVEYLVTEEHRDNQPPGKKDSWQYDPVQESQVRSSAALSYLALIGCTGYLDQGLEPRWLRLARLVAWNFSTSNAPAPKSCELRLAVGIAFEVGVEDPFRQSIAANHILNALTKEKLLALTLTSLHFTQGLRGMNEASGTLFRKPPEKLSWAQAAELWVGLGDYDGMHECLNPARLTSRRDELLERMHHNGAFPLPDLTAAQAQKLTCLSFMHKDEPDQLYSHRPGHRAPSHHRNPAMPTAPEAFDTGADETSAPAAE